MIIPLVNDPADLPQALSYLCGILNSFTFDFLIRPFVDKHIKGYVLQRLPIPASNPKNADVRSVAAKAEELSLSYPRYNTLTVFQQDNVLRTRAQVEALVARMTGLSSQEMEFILETFPIVKDDEIKQFGSFHTKELILEYYREG